jgi:hypothetical protein
MATNTNDGYRNGSVKSRSQFLNPQNETYVKRDDATGRFMAAKKTPWKGVADEPDGRKS